MSKDVLGKALKDYFLKPKNQCIVTHSSITEDDEMHLKHFFRNYTNMPPLEQKALSLCKGNVLDVGCGAGSHSLYLQKKQLRVTALDTSQGAIEVSKLRGVDHALVQDIFTYKPNEKFDSILVLMNGTGICGSLNNLAPFLKHLSSLLNKNGQILIDSSDIIYMYEDENGEHWIDASKAYYGEVNFSMTYNNETSNSFDWLYVDYNTLQRCAVFNGMKCELIEEGEHYDYLAKITKL